MDEELKSYLSTEFAGVRGEIEKSEARLRAEIERSETGLRGEIANLRAEIGDLRGEIANLRTEIVDVRSEIEKTETKLLRRFTHGSALSKSVSVERPFRSPRLTSVLYWLKSALAS